jgi:ribosomal protein S18 acetylase RimI-like enzyme
MASRDRSKWSSSSDGVPVSVQVTTGGSHPDDLRRIIDTLDPEWFGMPEENAAYVEKAKTLTNVVAREGDEVVGLCLLLTHSARSVEIDFLGVPRERHRQGIGQLLLAHIERDLSLAGVRLLHLKTFGPSVPNEPYERTRAFYERMGFVAMEERTDVWGPTNPCLFLVKPL